MLKKFPTYLFLALLCSGALFASDSEPTILENQTLVDQSDGGQNNSSKPKSSSKAVQPTSIAKQQPNQPCPYNWRLSGDFLYFVPTVDDTYFVIESGVSTTYPTLERKNNDFGYSPGFRVGAEYACCEHHRGAQAFYAYLNSDEKRTVSGENLWATTGRPDLSSTFEDYSGTASSNLNVLYHHLDVNFSQRLGNSYGLYYYVQPGMEYAYLRLNEAFTYFNEGPGSTGKVDQKSRLWGIGPQIGLVMDYNFIHEQFTCSSTQGFSFLAQFSGSLLVGRGKTENFQTLESPSGIITTLLNIKDEHTLRTIPALHARAGLSYFIRGERAGGSIELGYEFNSYLRALSRSIFVDDVADGLCFTDYYNFDIQGLYVSGKISF